MTCLVYIATSIDGYIARPDGGLDWLPPIEPEEGTDYGYNAFIDSIDAIVMGRNTFETVLGFDEWPYPKPVIVLSRTLQTLPEQLDGKVQIHPGPIGALLEELETKGMQRPYIDGGKTIQSFLAEDRIDEMTITTIPILLGKGRRLFGNLEEDLRLHHLDTVAYPNGLVKSHYCRA